jgi:hypothetical protein
VTATNFTVPTDTYIVRAEYARRQIKNVTAPIFFCPSDNLVRPHQRTYAMSGHDMQPENWPPNSDNTTGVGLVWNLAQFHALVRVERNDFDFNLAVRKPELPDEQEAQIQRQKTIGASRDKYATPRAEVEAALLARIWGDNSAPPSDELGGTPSHKPPPATPSSVPAIAKTPKKLAGPPSVKSTIVPAKEEVKLPVVVEPPPAVKPIMSTSEAVIAPTKVKTPSPAPVETLSVTVSKEQKAIPPMPTDDADEKDQHNAIKERIRIQAEALDYSVAFEEFVGNTQGRADVVLRRGERSIACEITVTTPVEYEVGNLTKCLNGKFSHVAAISRSGKKLERIRQLLAESLSPEQCASVAFYSPEEFISKLHDWALDDPMGGATEKGKPRRRLIDLSASGMTEAERKQREDDMLKSLTDAMRR